MARDTYIIRPDRLTRPTRAPAQELTRQERIKLLVLQVLPDVCTRIDTAHPHVHLRNPDKR